MSYDGPVCYVDGWHHAVDENGDPGDKLFLEDDGTYRPAEDGDESWHDRYHGQFVSIVPEGAEEPVHVSKDEWEAFQASRGDQ